MAHLVLVLIYIFKIFGIIIFWRNIRQPIQWKMSKRKKRFTECICISMPLLSLELKCCCVGGQDERRHPSEQHHDECRSGQEAGGATEDRG